MLFEEKYADADYIRSNDDRPIVVVEENKRKYRGENVNSQRVVVYRIDGGIIKDQDVSKCDFAVYATASKNVYFVELKGRDFSHAIEQLLSTIRQLVVSELDLGSVHARIVLSKVSNPDVRSSNRLALDRLLKRWSGELFYGSKEFSEQLH